MEKLSTPSLPIVITGISAEGRGIAHINGKTTFIQDALPGETVHIHYTKRRRQYDEAKATQIIERSSDRVQPQCPHYGICGGCSLQHAHTDMQLRHKEKVLLEQLHQIAGLQPKRLLPPLQGNAWAYRRRARLGVKYVTKKQAVLVGFREKNAHYLAQLQTCEILDTRIAQLILPLQRLIGSLRAYQAIPQIETALGEKTLALVFRHLVPLETEDCNKLKAFAKDHQLQLYLQPGNESTAHCIWPEIDAEPLYYSINLGNLPTPLNLFFKPYHFIQINAAINRSMINCAMELLEPNCNDQLLDLFCGLGNFSLPLATQSRSVTGIEGSPELVEQARENAMHNAISNVKFYIADLADTLQDEAWAQQSYNKLLLDPPRSGACKLIQQLASWKLERIVYISCHVGSLARDASELAKQGYHIEKAGIMDMFPHTSHSETICLFTK